MYVLFRFFLWSFWRMGKYLYGYKNKALCTLYLSPKFVYMPGKAPTIYVKFNHNTNFTLEPSVLLASVRPVNVSILFYLLFRKAQKTVLYSFLGHCKKLYTAQYTVFFQNYGQWTTPRPSSWDISWEIFMMYKVNRRLKCIVHRA